MPLPCLALRPHGSIETPGQGAIGLCIKDEVAKWD